MGKKRVLIICISCTNAQDALDLLKTDEEVDVILIDMMMPEMDGYGAIPRIKNIEKRAKTPIFSVTAQAMVGDREKCLRAGATEYISKPVECRSVVATAVTCLIAGG